MRRKNKTPGLSRQEKYQMDFAHGYRIGKIGAIRGMLIRALRSKGRVSTNLIRKINRDVDTEIMRQIFMDVITDKLSIAEIETDYELIRKKEGD
jgi:hypothetical protein